MQTDITLSPQALTLTLIPNSNPNPNVRVRKQRSRHWDLTIEIHEAKIYVIEVITAQAI